MELSLFSARATKAMRTLFEVWKQTLTRNGWSLKSWVYAVADEDLAKNMIIQTDELPHNDEELMSGLAELITAELITSASSAKKLKISRSLAYLMLLDKLPFAALRDANMVEVNTEPDSTPCHEELVTASSLALALADIALLTDGRYRRPYWVPKAVTAELLQVYTGNDSRLLIASGLSYLSVRGLISLDKDVVIGVHAEFHNFVDKHFPNLRQGFQSGTDKFGAPEPFVTYRGDAALIDRIKTLRGEDSVNLSDLLVGSDRNVATLFRIRRLVAHGHLIRHVNTVRLSLEYSQRERNRARAAAKADEQVAEMTAMAIEEKKELEFTKAESEDTAVTDKQIQEAHETLIEVARRGFNEAGTGVDLPLVFNEQVGVTYRATSNTPPVRTFYYSIPLRTLPLDMDDLSDAVRDGAAELREQFESCKDDYMLMYPGLQLFLSRHADRVRPILWLDTVPVVKVKEEEPREAEKKEEEKQVAIEPLPDEASDNEIEVFSGYVLAKHMEAAEEGEEEDDEWIASNIAQRYSRIAFCHESLNALSHLARRGWIRLSGSRVGDGPTYEDGRNHPKVVAKVEGHKTIDAAWMAQTIMRHVTALCSDDQAVMRPCSQLLTAPILPHYALAANDMDVVRGLELLRDTAMLTVEDGRFGLSTYLHNCDIDKEQQCDEDDDWSPRKEEAAVALMLAEAGDMRVHVADLLNHSCESARFVLFGFQYLWASGWIGLQDGFITPSRELFSLLRQRVPVSRTMANENFSQIGLDRSIYGVIVAWEHSKVLPSQHLVLRTFQWAGAPEVLSSLRRLQTLGRVYCRAGLVLRLHHV